MTQCQSKITVIARIIAPYAWRLLNGHGTGPTVTPMRRESESLSFVQNERNQLTKFSGKNGIRSLM